MQEIVLVTGATGFIGGMFVVRLLETALPKRLLLWVRASDAVAARERVLKSLCRFGNSERLEKALANCDYLCGDLGDANVLADARLEEVTHVVHLAANTSLLSVNSCRRTNLYGTLMLAHRMRRVRSLKRFLYVSTAYLCGSPAPALVRENDFPKTDSRHLAEYTRSKAESELLLDAIADGLPWVIARPSVVVGHTSFGCRPSASIFWYYRHLHLLRWLPVAADRRKDVVPVDYVADALRLLLLRTELKHRRYHISAGEEASATWAEIMATFDAADRIDSARPFAVGGTMPIPRADGDEDRMLGRAAECFVAFSQCGVEVFDNQRLLGEGMPPPQRFPNYLGLCLESIRGRTVNEMLRDDL